MAAVDSVRWRHWCAIIVRFVVTNYKRIPYKETQLIVVENDDILLLRTTIHLFLYVSQNCVRTDLNKTVDPNIFLCLELKRTIIIN